MIVKEEFMSKLRRYFNLNLYEVKIWTALLSRGVSTAGELSDIGQVPRSRAYDVLESLEHKGFVVQRLGKPIKYLAVEPMEVIERVKKLIRQDAEMDVMKLRELKDSNVLLELNTLYKNGIEYVDSSDLSGAIRGKQNLYAHLENVVKNAQESVTLVTTSRGLIQKADVLKPIFQKLNKKNVKIRVAAPINKDSQVVLKDLKGLAEIRDAKKLDARFCVVDGKEILFMVMDDKDVHPSYDVGIWVNTPYFAKAFENMFDLAWKDLPKAR